MAPVKRANSDPDVLEDVKKAKLDTTVAANEDALTAMPITNKAQPTLLGMPREIRDMIYEYAIAGHEITPETLEGGFWVTASAYNQPCDTFAQWKKLNSLSLVNRQLREETKLLPYSLSVINIVAGYESGD
ncbi:hypothetical protein J1614_002506 [Plenodomus biglobosus]|nr:hypothetical protein J1614_002506 [Plenodomus biglobosus]